MRKGSIVPIVTSLLVVGGTFAWLGARRGGAGDRQAPDSSELHDLRDEVAGLRSAVRRSESVAGAAVMRVASAESTLARPREDGDRPAAADIAPEPPASVPVAELRRRAEQRFREEPRDPAWIPEAEVQARDQLQQGLSRDSEIRSIECRSTMCRGEIAYPDRATYLNYLHDLYATPGRVWEAGVSWYQLGDRGDGKQYSELFIGRPGTDPSHMTADEPVAASP